MLQALVADAGPLIALAKLELLHQLPVVFSRLTIPHVVLLEATAQGRPGAAQILQFVGEHTSFVNIAPTAQSLLVDELQPLLDDGEVQAIHWAHELGCPVFIDEQRGRKCATDHGIQVFGTSGFLVRCKQLGLIEVVVLPLRTLQKQGYFLSNELLARIARAANEPL